MLNRPLNCTGCETRPPRPAATAVSHPQVTVWANHPGRAVCGREGRSRWEGNQGIAVIPSGPWPSRIISSGIR